MRASFVTDPYDIKSQVWGSDRYSAQQIIAIPCLAHLARDVA